VVVIDAVAFLAAVFGAEVVPWGGLDVFAAVLLPVDAGGMTGHLALAPGILQFDRLKDDFASASGIQWSLVGQFAAIEVLRWLLGVAQLPLSLNLKQRVQLINDAASALRA